ncbi:sugar O-acetyltransferase [Parasalinivibrio latis]|uniref:DapH/DapD/GlmU-related protein n=1 Tax=Parasalinivibrio latis TaxID=2952610 RepID=UPI0030E4C8FD
MTELERMQKGLPFKPKDEELKSIHHAARRLCRDLQAQDPADEAAVDVIVTKLFSSRGRQVIVEAPFICEYGINIDLGDNVLIHPNCTILDSAHVTIGSNVVIGPCTGIYTAVHDLLPRDIDMGESLIASPVIIGSNVVIGGNSVIRSGVSIGEGAVIEAGSVVNADVEPFAVVSGHPATVQRRLS